MATTARARGRKDTERRRSRPRGAAAVIALLAAACSAEEQAGEEQGEPVESFMHAHGLEIPAWSPETIYLATHEGLIGIDAAGEWRLLSEDRHDFMGFSAHPDETELLYSSGHPSPASDLPDPLGFMVSTDGGHTWETRSLLGEVDFHAMTVGAGGAAIYGWDATGGGLLRSTDEGHEWEEVEAPALFQAGGALSLAGHPEDAEKLWAGTEEGLLRSTDGGESWQVLGEDPVTALSIDPADPERILAYTAPPGPGLLESGDAGETFAPLDWAPEGDAVGHLAVHPEDPEFIAAATHGESLYRSQDGGGSWEALATAGVPD